MARPGVKYMGYGVYLDDSVCVLSDLTCLPFLGGGRKSWYIMLATIDICVDHYHISDGYLVMAILRWPVLSTN